MLTPPPACRTTLLRKSTFRIVHHVQAPPEFRTVSTIAQPGLRFLPVVLEDVLLDHQVVRVLQLEQVLDGPDGGRVSDRASPPTPVSVNVGWLRSSIRRSRTCFGNAVLGRIRDRRPGELDLPRRRQADRLAAEGQDCAVVPCPKAGAPRPDRYTPLPEGRRSRPRSQSRGRGWQTSDRATRAASSGSCRAG